MTAEQAPLSSPARKLLLGLHLPYPAEPDARTLLKVARDIRLVTEAEAEVSAADLDATGEHCLLSCCLDRIEDYLRGVVWPQLEEAAPKLLGVAASLQEWKEKGFAELVPIHRLAIADELEAIGRADPETSSIR